MYKVYYKNELIKEFHSLEEAENYVVEFKEVELKRTQKAQKIAKELIKKIEKLPPKRPSELSDKYNERIQTQYPQLAKELEDLGKFFYQEDYLSCKFHDNKEHMVVFSVVFHDIPNAKINKSLGNLLTDILASELCLLKIKIES